MKNLFTLFSVFVLTTVFGQNLVETRSAVLMDGDYELSGNVYLELYDDNSLNLRFGEDYSTTTNVFDVHVFLTNNNDYTAPIDTAGMLLVENIGTISGLNYSSGSMTFNLPSGVKIDDYEHIVFICLQFGRLNWGSGVFGESVPIATNSIAENKELAVTVYPNPVKENFFEVKFKNQDQHVLIEVIDMQGHIVLSKEIEQEQNCILELNQPGTYFLKLTSGSLTSVRKIVKITPY